MGFYQLELLTRNIDRCLGSIINNRSRNALRYISENRKNVGFVAEKLSLMVLCGCLSLSPSAAREQAAKSEPTKPKVSHRERRFEMFRLSRFSTASIVMLGDSLTEGAPWPEIIGCGTAVNRGIGGDSSAGVLSRIDSITALKPRAVFLMIGVNDIASEVPADKIVLNVRQIIDSLHREGAKIYLTLVLPVTEKYRRRLNPAIDELNSGYKTLADEGNVTVIDFRADVQTEKGFLREDMSTDGLHLLPSAYHSWRDAILPYINSNCS